MAETGAEICLDQHDLKGCEKYLNMALAADRFVTQSAMSVFRHGRSAASAS